LGLRVDGADVLVEMPAVLGHPRDEEAGFLRVGHAVETLEQLTSSAVSPRAGEAFYAVNSFEFIDRLTSLQGDGWAELDERTSGYMSPANPWESPVWRLERYLESLHTTAKGRRRVWTWVFDAMCKGRRAQAIAAGAGASPLTVESAGMFAMGLDLASRLTEGRPRARPDAFLALRDLTKLYAHLS
jgi:hypothetical protein